MINISKQAVFLQIILCIIIMLFSGCATQQSYHDEGGENCPISDTTNIYRMDYSLLEMLFEINKEIGQTATVEAELTLIAGNQPNAFTWQKEGKRFIALNSALLQLLRENEDEYAFVIAHENAHISQGHLDKRKKYNEGMEKKSGALSLALEVIGIGFGIPFGGLISSLTTDSGTHLMALGYSRDQEREADKKGLEYMIKAGFNPNGALTFLEKFQALPDSSSIPFLSTHPLGDERLTLLKTKMKKSNLTQNTKEHSAN